MDSTNVSSPMRRIDHLIQAADYFLKYEAMVFDEFVEMELRKEASS